MVIGGVQKSTPVVGVIFLRTEELFDNFEPLLVDHEFVGASCR